MLNTRAGALELDDSKRQFRDRFGVEPRVFSAPGRVNLIGEHTDYNDGFVLPFAIDLRTYVLGAARNDRRIVAHSETLDQEVAIDLDLPPQVRRGSFIDYVEGVARTLLADGVRVAGANLWITSSVPPGAGLSASAALELAVGLALASLGGELAKDPTELALAGQRAEHEYVGTLCGIMDQLASALGRAGHALLIDCRSLEVVLVPLPVERAALVVCDTGVKHTLASSEYNRRRSECGEGVAVLQKTLPSVRALRDVSLEGLLSAWPKLDATVFRRCHHVVTENARTLAARDALARGDLAELGLLMKESHRSLRDDYEVSCPELDLAVETALAVPGVHGARMTGGGFGGSTITLCVPECVEELAQRVDAALARRFGLRPHLFRATPSDGVRIEP